MRQCSEIIGCAYSTVGLYLHKYNIPVRSYEDWMCSQLRIQIDGKLKDILYGALLGDGSLVIQNRNDDSKSNARFGYASTSYQHVEYVTKKFMEYAIGGGITTNTSISNMTHKPYTTYIYQSHRSPDFTDEYYKWYINGIKHIPSDLILTPLMCKIWYLGDGSLSNHKNSSSQRIALATNCFEKNELEEIIIPQLSDFEAHLLHVGKTKSGMESYITVITSKINIKKFLSYIGPCPFEDYKHKWDIIEPFRNKKQETKDEKNN